MLKGVIFFFIMALIAAVFVATSIATADAGIAKMLFFIFIELFVIALISGFRARPGR